MRNSKALWLTLLAALVVAAFGAQSASAAEFSFTSAANTTVLTATTEPGTSEVLRVTNGAPISCTDISYRGTAVGKVVDHVTVYPDYSGASCSIPTLGAVTVDNPTSGGCTITLDSDTNGSGHAGVSLECGDTGKIQITAPGCTITIETTHSTPAPNTIVNHDLTGVVYTNVLHNGVGSITVNGTLTGIKSTAVGVNCALVGLGNGTTHTTGTYTGKVTATGYEDNGGTGHGPFTEGAQVAVSVD